MRIYDWAKEVRTAGQCVISGFHSSLERDVLDILLKGKQPVILAAARGLPKRYSSEVKQAIDNGRLLVVSPFPDSVRRITADTSRTRNECMLALADRIVVGSMSEGGILKESLAAVSHKEIIKLGD